MVDFSGFDFTHKNFAHNHIYLQKYFIRFIAANAGENIDIIVGGHSHSLLYTGQPPNGVAVDVYPIVVPQPNNKMVIIVQAASHTKYLGNVSLNFDPEGNLISWEGKPIYLDRSIPQDPNILKMLKPYNAEVNAIGKKEIGSSHVLLSKSQCIYGECNIGNFITDAFVESMVTNPEKGYWTRASICILNQGGIRANINKGSITYEDLIIAQPFENHLHSLDLKGKYIIEALEHAVNTTYNSIPFSSGNMLQVSGLQVVFNVSKPIGKRVEKVLVKCAKCDVPHYFPIQQDTSYRLIVPIFIANGGDGFVAISNNKENVKIHGIDIDILEAHLKKFSPMTTSEDNRIIITK